jgi:3-methylcrotonyl-CoA carboxylase beta subunit
VAKLILTPIGAPISNQDSAFVKNSELMAPLDEKLGNKRAAVKLGWGEKYQERVREKGKLTTWDRLEKLADSPDQIFPILTFVNDGDTFGEGSNARTSPSAGVVTAFVRVHGRLVMAIANDNTVASGSWWPRTPEKIIRAQSIALKLRLPVIYLVDCSGLFLPEQGRTFPGQYGAGHIFKMNSELSAAGVPQVAGVFGDCIAGGGYMPIISDKVYMTEQAYMVIAGAALIKGAKSLHLSSLDIGGPNVHVHLSNCADYRVPDDATCISRIRDEVSRMAASACAYYRDGEEPSAPHFPPDEMTGLVPATVGQAYDIKQVLARLLDDSLFKEYWPNVGHEVVVGVGKIGGLYVGVAANVQDLLPHPEHPEQKRPGGIIYREGVAKLAAFSRACNDDGIPLVWLQDIAGFDVGIEAEKQGLLGYGSSLIYSNSTNTTPMITVLLRKASGAGYYAMAGLPYEPVLQLATPISRLAVMDGRTLAIGAFNSRLDDNFQIVAKNEEERAQVEAGMKAVEARIEADMDPYKSARQLDVDEIVRLDEIRRYLECVVEACYQSQGTRRIKNPRIWSLHDHEILSSPVAKGGQGDFSEQSPVRAVKTKTSAGGKKFVSPMEGLVYLRASPSDPEFVHEGQTVKPGDTVALIEVMKCFYPIKFEGAQPVKVTSVVATHGAAVSAGDAIFCYE